MVVESTWYSFHCLPVAIPRDADRRIGVEASLRHRCMSHGLPNSPAQVISDRPIVSQEHCALLDPDKLVNLTSKSHSNWVSISYASAAFAVSLTRTKASADQQGSSPCLKEYYFTLFDFIRDV
jgi:hypothetical protein